MEANDPSIVIFGEVLFDVFPDGHAVLGGAPFNVAWNLQGLGLSPLFVSRVGDDERGRRVLDAMESWGMSTTGVEVDPERPTGVVEVSVENGNPSYEIVPDQAYDFVSGDAALEAIGATAPALLYRGTLATRSAVSRAALEGLDAVSPQTRFIDVNLRAPWWTASEVREAVRRADVVKLNQDELEVLDERDEDDCEGDPGGETNAGENDDRGRSVGDLEARAQRLVESWNCRLLVVTRGESGAVAVGPDGAIGRARPAPLAADVADTVGAGDALSAVCILGLTRGWDVETILRRAVDYAATVCTIRGATTTARRFYSVWAARWSE